MNGACDIMFSGCPSVCVRALAEAFSDRPVVDF